MKIFSYTLKAQSGLARSGVLTTPHGTIETPVFMPVGTLASVKSLTPDDLMDAHSSIILANTYHLYLRPGHGLVHTMGGLHQFMKWNRPILTDSGGYQVSSLGLFKETPGKLSKIDEDGVTFYSHLDGSEHRFTPKLAIEIQEALGADIIMAFDEATPNKGKEYAQKAMERTHRWLNESINVWKQMEEMKSDNNVLPQALFGIIQGGSYEELRYESTQFVVEKDLPGIAIGGGSIGQSREETETNMQWIRPHLPMNKPWYLMGVGKSPSEVVGAIQSGADMFDCVAPTRLARCGLLYHGHLNIPAGDVMKASFTSDFPHERLSIDKQEFAEDESPIDTECSCYTCRNKFSRAYLRHLFRSRELTYYRLASIHNVAFLNTIAEKMREAILTCQGYKS